MPPPSTAPCIPTQSHVPVATSAPFEEPAVVTLEIRALPPTVTSFLSSLKVTLRTRSKSIAMPFLSRVNVVAYPFPPF